MRLVRSFASSRGPVLTKDTINKNVVKAEYSVKGEIWKEQERIQLEINQGKHFPFGELCHLHLGNPQLYGMQPVSFHRQVLSICLHPQLLDSPNFSDDVKRRAQEYLDNFISVGCYTESKGNPMVPKNIAKYISKRDKVFSDPENILIYNGVSEALSNIIQTINVPGKNVGFMAPVPQYSLYSARIQLNDANFVGYLLDEDNEWEVDEFQLNKSYEEATAKGVEVKALIAINPGNPTGQVFSRKSIEAIFRFAFERGIVVLADETYQEVIHSDLKPFISFRKVLSELPSELANSVELISFHSCSKGGLGESGLRSGYCELHNIDPGVAAVIYKLKTIFLSSNSVGQIMMDLKVRPPTIEDSSKETVDEYQRELRIRGGELKTKAIILEHEIRSMRGVTVNQIQGGYYGFPRLHLPEKFIAEAKSKGLEPDYYYCLKALHETGVVLSAGSGFKQKPGTYHFRCTILENPISFFNRKLESLLLFNDSIQKKYK